MYTVYARYTLLRVTNIYIYTICVSARVVVLRNIRKYLIKNNSFKKQTDPMYVVKKKKNVRTPQQQIYYTYVYIVLYIMVSMVGTTVFTWFSLRTLIISYDDGDRYVYRGSSSCVYIIIIFVWNTECNYRRRMYRRIIFA